MELAEKVRCWFGKNKGKIILGGTVFLSFVGYVLCNGNKMSVSDWLNKSSDEDLREAYEIERLTFCKTGVRSPAMEQISHELGERGAKEWFDKHPPNADPHFRWTDANRWDKD